HDGRVEVDQVGQLALVQLKVGAGTNLLGQVVVGGHHHVVATLAGGQLAVEGIVGIKYVVNDLDAGFLLEIGQGVRSNVIGPVIDFDHPVVGLGHGHAYGGGNHTCQQ